MFGVHLTPPRLRNALLIITAATTGAAGSFVKEAITSGSQWLRDKFAHHSEKAAKKGGENASEFLNELATIVKKLDETSDFLHHQIETAMSHPDFSILMQQALISAAQTESKEKHVLLAQVVADRLQATSDSLLALTTPLACGAISHITSQQLRILGFYYSLKDTKFSPRIFLFRQNN